MARTPNPTPSAPASGMMLFSQPLTPAPSAQRAGLIARVRGAFAAFAGSGPRVTTETGVAGSASPLVSSMQRLAQVWDRRAVAAEVWTLYQTDPRFRASVDKYCRKAVAGGFKLSVTARAGATAMQARRAQTEAENLLRRVGLLGPDGKPNCGLLATWLTHGRVEADLFLQHVVAWKDGEDGARAGDVVKVKVMPSSGMERLTDDSDEFLDPARAFVQMDVNTQQVVGEFAAFQIGHHRWKRLGEDRYGQFEYAVARDIAARLTSLEGFHEYRRKANAARLIDHTVGEVGNSSTTQKDIDAYKAAVGLVDKSAIVTTDPAESISQLYHDGNVTVKAIPGDASVHEIGDLTYFLEKLGAATGTPIQILGMNVAGVARDTLDMIVAEWLDGMAYDVQFVHGAIHEIIRLQLELKGMNADAFDISLAVPARVFESAADAIAFVNKCMTNTLGAGMNAKPYPLLTAETAVQILAEYLGVTDAEGYVARLEAMMADKHLDADTVHGMQMMGADPGVQSGATNSKAGGGASTGHGERFEGGKRTDGKSKPAGGEAYKKKP